MRYGMQILFAQKQYLNALRPPIQDSRWEQFNMGWRGYPKWAKPLKKQSVGVYFWQHGTLTKNALLQTVFRRFCPMGC